MKMVDVSRGRFWKSSGIRATKNPPKDRRKLLTEIFPVSFFPEYDLSGRTNPLLRTFSKGKFNTSLGHGLAERLCWLRCSAAVSQHNSTESALLQHNLTD